MAVRAKIEEDLPLRAGPLRSGEAAILCESLWGPLWFDEHRLQAAFLMRSEMTEEQERCLEPFPVITVALDNDAAGTEKAARIRGKLKAKHRILKARMTG
jgi:hypothetical protein